MNVNSSQSRDRSESYPLFGEPPASAEPASGTGAILDGLNEAQRAAVEHGDGPLLILAGAGSGKTRVITRRIAHLIQARGVAPWQVLAITFTNKAAGELRERCASLGVPAGAWLSTFHSMCARILRRDIEHLGGFTRYFTIYDTDDRSKLLRDLIKSAGYDTTAYKPGDVGAWISERKNRGSDEPTRFGDGVYQRIESDYEAALRKNNALDFDDLLLRVIELFEAADRKSVV